MKTQFYQIGHIGKLFVTMILWSFISFLSGCGSSPITATTGVVEIQTDSLPTPPEKLQAKPVSTSRIDLSWENPATNAVSFKIERLQGSDFHEIATVDVSRLNYSDTGLDPMTIYYYRVRAVNTAGNSACSNVADARTPPLEEAKPELPVIEPDVVGVVPEEAVVIEDEQ